MKKVKVLGLVLLLAGLVLSCASQPQAETNSAFSVLWEGQNLVITNNSNYTLTIGTPGLSIYFYDQSIFDFPHNVFTNAHYYINARSGIIYNHDLRSKEKVVIPITEFEYLPDNYRQAERIVLSFYNNSERQFERIEINWPDYPLIPRNFNIDEWTVDYRFMGAFNLLSVDFSADQSDVPDQIYGAAYLVNITDMPIVLPFFRPFSWLDSRIDYYYNHITNNIISGNRIAGITNTEILLADEASIIHDENLGAHIILQPNEKVRAFAQIFSEDVRINYPYSYFSIGVTEHLFTPSAQVFLNPELFGELAYK